jgi:HTH-type transcriptional regulator/antitoxin HigA
MKTKKPISFTQLPRTYSGLVAYFPPRPVHDSVDEANTEEIVLAMAGHKLNKDQQDYLDILSDQLLKYQSERHAEAPDKRGPLERLKYLLDDNGLKPADLQRILGCSQSLVSLILLGKRELSKDNILKLAARFKVGAGYFM